MVVIEAQDAWWPPTFRPSRLSRRWLALWMVQVDSQRRRASMADSRSIARLLPVRAGGCSGVAAAGTLMAYGYHRGRGRICRFRARFRRALHACGAMEGARTNASLGWDRAEPSAALTSWRVRGCRRLVPVI